MNADLSAGKGGAVATATGGGGGGETRIVVRFTLLLVFSAPQELNSYHKVFSSAIGSLMDPINAGRY